MSDLADREPEDELKRYWQADTVYMRNTREAALARELSLRVTQFDRKIFWRNFREYAAGLAVLIWSAFMAFKGHKPSIAMALGVAFVMAFLWWQHRRIGQPDPSTNVLVFEKALLERYDSQIRLLSRVRYWYLLPLYVPIVWMAIEWFRSRGWGSILMLAIVTAAFVFIGWLNETLAVGQLKEARTKLAVMMFEQEKEDI